MAVADLREAESALALLCRGLAEEPGDGYAGFDCPDTVGWLLWDGSPSLSDRVD